MHDAWQVQPPLNRQSSIVQSSMSPLSLATRKRGDCPEQLNPSHPAIEPVDDWRGPRARTSTARPNAVSATKLERSESGGSSEPIELVMSGVCGHVQPPHGRVEARSPRETLALRARRTPANASPSVAAPSANRLESLPFRAREASGHRRQFLDETAQRTRQPRQLAGGPRGAPGERPRIGRAHIGHAARASSRAAVGQRSDGRGTAPATAPARAGRARETASTSGCSPITTSRTRRSGVPAPASASSSQIRLS